MDNSKKSHIVNAVEITEDILSVACPIAGTALSIGEKVVDELIEHRKESSKDGGTDNMITITEEVDWKESNGNYSAIFYGKFKADIKLSAKRDRFDEDEYFLTIYDRSTNKILFNKNGDRNSVSTLKKIAEKECKKLLNKNSSNSLESLVKKSVSSLCNNNTINGKLYEFISNECSNNINKYFDQTFAPNGNNIDDIRDSIIDYLLYKAGV